MFSKHLTKQLSGFGLGVVVWLVAVVWGFCSLAVYSHTPGPMGAPPEYVEAPSDLPESGGIARFRLVMAIHPKCPCTRATLGELERLIAKCGPDLACLILVYHPADASPAWWETDTVAKARRLPRVCVSLDPDGRRAKRMRLKTSGGVILYALEGKPVFYGGITPSRGHQGDNLGSDAILSLVREGVLLRDHGDVYGCPLQRPSADATAQAPLQEGV